MKSPQHKDSLEPKIFHWKPFSMLWGYRTRRLIKSSIKLVYQWRSIEYSVLLATKRTWVQFPAAASSFKQKYDKSKQIMVDSIIVIIMSLACKLSCESPPPHLWHFYPSIKMLIWKGMIDYKAGGLLIKWGWGWTQDIFQGCIQQEQII